MAEMGCNAKDVDSDFTGSNCKFGHFNLYTIWRVRCQVKDAKEH